MSSRPDSSASAPSLQTLRASRGKPPSRLRRLRKWIIAGGGLAGLIAFGFWGLPPIAKAQAIKQLSTRLGREVTIEKVRINPLVLSATIEGFAIAEAEPTSGEFTGWRRLYVNFDSWSVLAGKIRFQAIELDGFRARVAKGEAGGLNFDDIVARLTAKDPAAPAPTDASEPDKKPTPVAIGKLSVTDARVSFDDASRARDFSTVVGPLSFTLENFQTVGDPNSPYQFEAVTEAGERVAWNGTVSADPAKSQGELIVSNLDLARLSPYYHQLVAGELRSALLDLSGHYTFELRDGEPVLTLADGAITLREIRVGAPGVESDALVVKTLSLGGIAADSVARSATIEKLAISGVRVAAKRDAQGIDLPRLFAPTTPRPSEGDAAGENVAADNAPADPGASGAVATAPRVALREFVLGDFKLELTDLTTPRPAVHRVEDMTLTVRDIDSASLASALPVDLAIVLPDGGRFAVLGSISPAPLGGDLDIALEGLSLAGASPYIEPFINARLASGVVRGQGKVTLRDGRTNFAGGVGVADFATVDGKLAQDFVKWGDFSVSGIKFGTTPLAFHADLVRLERPVAALRIEADGSLSIAQAGPPKPKAEKEPADLGRVVRQEVDLPPTKPTSGPRTGAVIPKNPLPLAITVNRVEIEAGAFRYEDRSIKPAAKLALNEFGGAITGLSTETMGRADVRIQGKVDGVAPVSITGKLNPLGTPAFVDLVVDFKGIDLHPNAGPYIGKFAGRDLSRGSLSLAVKAKLDERRVNVDNVVTLDQFYLGAPNNSPDATRLPVGLALSLLRDTQGRIVIDVPVRGSLDDPAFRVGRVVVRVLTNIVAKAATSPFSLLGAAFGGGGDELGWQDFTAGSSTPAAAGIQKLETVAKALNNRPALRLDIAGAYDPVADLAALRRVQLDQQVRSLAWETRRLSDPNTPPPEQLDIAPPLHAGMVAKLYTAEFPPAEGDAGTLVVSGDGDRPLTVPLVPSPPPEPVMPVAVATEPAPRRTVGRLPKYSNAARSPETPTAATPQAPESRQAPTPGASQTGSPETPEQAAPTLSLADMEARLMARIEVPEDDLRALADARAQSVRAWLIETGKVPADRIFLAPITNTGTRVNLSLK